MVTWDDFANLTPAQRLKLAEFAVIGQSTNPDFSGVTRSQAKAVRRFLVELNTLVAPAHEGMRRTIQHLNNALIKADDDANP